MPAQTTAPAEEKTKGRKRTLTGGELFARCLENEGVDYIFGVPGEENIDLLDALIDSPVQLRPDPARAGRGLHRGCLWPADRPTRRLLVDARPWGDEPRYRRGRCQHGSRATRRDRRAGCDDPDAQGESPDPRPGEPLRPDHQVLDPDPHARGDPRDRAQGVQDRTDREARRLLHRLSREHCRRRGCR